MTLQQHAALKPVIEPRKELSRLVGRVVTCEGVYGNEARRTDTGAWLYIVKDIVIYPKFHYAHLWLELPQHVRRRLNEGARFSFRAEVCEYERSNSTKDYGIKFTEWLKG